MDKPNNNVSLIITTYNREDALVTVLKSVLEQSKAPNEIIVADDGSTEATARAIDAFGKEHSGLNIRHVWHEDEGFRASKIRNRAIAAARHDYVILIDGDMVLHHHFIADHCRIADKNCFVQGGRVMLGPDHSKTIMSDGVSDIGFWTLGIGNRKNGLRLPLLSNWTAKFSANNLSRVRSCNQSFWMKDLLTVNGFDEAYEGWGNEDVDIALRLMNAGVRRLNLRFSGIAYHLWHERPDKSREMMNAELLREAESNKSIRCEKGLSIYL